MKFCWVTINVQDMEKSLSFYQDIIGLKVHRTMNPMPGTEIAFLGSDESGTEVELIRNEKNSNPQHGRDISLGFTVDSVETMMSILKERRIQDIEGPFQPNPHIKFIFVTDPDGVRIQFVENIQ